MWLVAGLGNPGKKYARNRHNVGFMVVEMLAERWSMPAWREKFGGETTSGRLGSDKAILLKPMEYMNHSGFAVTRAARFHDVEPERIIVVHDEIDLPFGRLRLKAGGGHGGHNGLRSIVAQLGSRDFLRVRLGVGKPERTDGGPGDGKVSRHVLSDFTADQQSELETLLRSSADAVEAIIDGGIREAMNKFNGLAPTETAAKNPSPNDPKSAKDSDPEPKPTP